MIPGYKRVSRSCRCPVCHKPDWCLIALDGSSAICPRVWEGSRREIGEAGYLHVIDETTHQSREPVKYVAPPPDPVIDAEFLSESFENAMERQAVAKSFVSLCEEMGLSEAALSAFRIGWSADHGAWSFPMVNELGHVIGIRLRKPDGFKLCVKGSRTGLFIPQTFEWAPTTFITEGPTDAAAMLDMGFEVFARPDCRSNVDRIVTFIQGSPRSTTIAIVSDTDKYGVEGAHTLARRIAPYRACKVIRPLGGKDVRQWKNQYHATPTAVMSVVRNAPLIVNKEIA